MKCICINNCSFYKIDDSISQTENGGKIEYEKHKEYEVLKIIDNWGTYYKVIYSNDKDVCFWESEINDKGVRLTTSDKIFSFYFKLKK